MVLSHSGFQAVIASEAPPTLVTKGLPDYAKDPWYWIVSTLVALSGGVLGLAYCCAGIEDMHPILAINIGASAPLILASIASNAPNLSPPSD